MKKKISYTAFLRYDVVYSCLLPFLWVFKTKRNSSKSWEVPQRCGVYRCWPSWLNPPPRFIPLWHYCCCPAIVAAWVKSKSATASNENDCSYSASPQRSQYHSSWMSLRLAIRRRPPSSRRLPVVPDRYACITVFICGSIPNGVACRHN